MCVEDFDKPETDLHRECCEQIFHGMNAPGYRLLGMRGKIWSNLFVFSGTVLYSI